MKRYGTMRFKNVEEIMAVASARKSPKRVAIAAAESDHVLEAAIQAQKDGFIEPLLVGDRKQIDILLERMGEQVSDDRIFEASGADACAKTAVNLVKEGAADFLMKGKLNTAELLRAVLNKEHGLPHGKLVTQLTFVDIEKYHKVFVMSDAAIVPYPTLEQKAIQIQLLTEALHSLGYGDDIKVGILCAVENASPKMPETEAALELKRMNRRGEITGCIVEGPISFDIALDKDVARVKGFDSPAAGDVDILIMPNMVTGNVLAKALNMFGNTRTVGSVLGASVPISITSRAASVKTKYQSLAVTSAIVG